LFQTIKYKMINFVSSFNVLLNQ